MARPTKYNEEIVKNICDYIETGVSATRSAIVSGISEATFEEWKKNKQGFRGLLEVSRQKWLVKLQLSVAKGAKDDPKIALQLLQKFIPEEYGITTNSANSSSFTQKFTEIVVEMPQIDE